MRAKLWKWGWTACAAVLVLMLAAGCGGGPKADVSVFLMPPKGMLPEQAEKLEASLKEKLGDSPTVQVNSKPIYDDQILLVEVAAGEHGVLIIPERQFKGFGQQGGMVALDDLFNPEDYPGGVLEAPVDDKGKLEKHLYGIPLAQKAWLQQVGYKGEEVYAFIHPRAKNMEQAKKVLQAIVNM
ncbi:hypothetical protein J31TS4_20680 [Paenibacillus sp. J31TS4]|uniref:hypothetical protein n=1 Tax=Paenibacillus sp. J31TS4 TaxID=2807195 RepID=UPI001B21E7A3|nr:hypothetical protein [Paenibacillus sp. J31TS4]GIP38788.1 hypothetical protein J31TS4_20680 [Paenibacillus sp. J31TS4]